MLAALTGTDEIGYVGVWAPDADACGTVDQPGATGTVVITRYAIRQGDSSTRVKAAPAVDGKATLTVAGDQTVEIVQHDPNAISVNGTPLVRCTAQ